MSSMFQLLGIVNLNSFTHYSCTLFLYQMLKSFHIHHLEPFKPCSTVQRHQAELFLRLRSDSNPLHQHASTSKVSSGWRRFHPRALHCCSASSSGHPAQEGQGPVGEGPEKDMSCVKRWNTSPMRKGWQDWDCSTWKREGFEVT